MPHRTSSRRLAPLAAIALAALALPAAASAKGAQTVQCKGTDASCTATVSLAGGASNKKLTIDLPGTSQKLVHARATPAYVNGAFALSGGRYSLGGSVYTVTLNAVESIPKGAKLLLEFATPDASLNCGGIDTGVAYLTTTNTGDAPARDFGCPQAAGAAIQWLKQFNAFKPTTKVKAKGIAYTCRVVPRVPQNIACASRVGTLVRFAAPTGH
jgi:hypothetical protein